MNIKSLIRQEVAEMKPSGIRKFFDLANSMDNVVSLSIGEPDFQTPWHVRDEGIYSLEKSRTHYLPNAGLPELRMEIANYLRRRFSLEYAAENVLVTVGGSEAIDLAFRVLLQQGDEVLLPEPCFVCYEPLAELAGGKVVKLETSAKNNFALTPEALEAAITPKSKILLLSYPNNPTGAVMNAEELRALAEVIIRHDLFCISDEIYAELTYTQEGHTSIASIPGMKERTLIVNGFSKAYAMTGWRLGYAVGDPYLIKMMIKLHAFSIMCASTTSQYAACEALREGDEDIFRMRDEYDTRRRIIVDGFRKMGFPCFEPKGAFYVFPDISGFGLSSEEFCEKLLRRKKVAIVPGNAFGQSGEGFARVSYAASMDSITKALERIESFISQL